MLWITCVELCAFQVSNLKKVLKGILDYYAEVSLFCVLSGPILTTCTPHIKEQNGPYLHGLNYIMSLTRGPSLTLGDCRHTSTIIEIAGFRGLTLYRIEIKTALHNMVKTGEHNITVLIRLQYSSFTFSLHVHCTCTTWKEVVVSIPLVCS